MAYSHLGHDCIIGNHCIIANYGGLAGHVILEDYVTLTGMVGVSQFVRVGAHAYIGGQSGLERDVPPYVIAMGSRPTAIKGCNIVGLRRRGVPSDVIQKINEAIKLWNRPGRSERAVPARNRIPVRRSRAKSRSSSLSSVRAKPESSAERDMKILISAAETSSDAHAAELLKALRAKSQRIDRCVRNRRARSSRPRGSARFSMRASCFRWVSSRFSGDFPRFSRRSKDWRTRLAREKPDVAVVLDYPDFHFRLAKRLSKLGIPLVYYIPPKVWAWRGDGCGFSGVFPEDPLHPAVRGGLLRARAGSRRDLWEARLQDELPLQRTREECRTAAWALAR